MKKYWEFHFLGGFCSATEVDYKESFNKKSSYEIKKQLSEFSPQINELAISIIIIKISDLQLKKKILCNLTINNYI